MGCTRKCVSTIVHYQASGTRWGLADVQRDPFSMPARLEDRSRAKARG
jgi:hypothetical protein